MKAIYRVKQLAVKSLLQQDKAFCRFLVIIGLLLSGLFGNLFFSHSAYAATSYLNVSSSSGGDLSFGKVRPSATGVSATTSDTLTINTNCTAGYSVYISAQSGKGTSLVNTDPNIIANNTITTSSAAIGSATTLSNNTWGLSVDSTSATTGQYVGLPTYANALNTPFTIKTNVAEQTTVPIYYGIKITTSLTPGTYTGDILYTVLADPTCNSYAIHFNSNGGTGTMNDQTIPTGTATRLDINTFTRSGYVFIGWSDSATGKTGTATNGIGTTADLDYTDGQSVTDISGTGTTKDLYAIWTPISGDMQSWGGSECMVLSVGQQIYLQDTRDGGIYAVKKLPDGKCWMVQNLALGMSATTTGLTLTPSNTNIDNGTTYYLPPAGKQGSSTIDQSSTRTATNTASFIEINDNRAKTKFRTKDSSIVNDSNTGYYNFYTATLGFSYYGDGKTSGSSTRDICPKGWRLPWTSDSGTTRDLNADFYVLALAYNPNPTWVNSLSSSMTNNPYTSDSIIENGMYLGIAIEGNNYAGFSYAGFYDNTSSYDTGIGSGGSYWANSVYNTTGGYRLRFNSSDVRPQASHNKYVGSAVRCIAKPPTMQDFDASTSLPNVGDQMELEDTRDHRTYTVKRLPDGKVWMTQNLALGMDATETGLTLTPADTNIDNNTTYYLPPAGKQGSSTIDDSSTLTATATAAFSGASDNRAKTRFRAKDSSVTNDSDTGYYNFYTATLGYSYYNSGSSGSSTRDICPKGWGLPKTTDNGTSVSTTGSANDLTNLTRTYSTSGWSGTTTSNNYGTNNSVARTGIYTGLAAAGNDYAGFSLTGYYEGSARYSVGTAGRYWSSSIYNTGNSYDLAINTSNVSPQFCNSKNYGIAVRCIAK